MAKLSGLKSKPQDAAVATDAAAAQVAATAPAAEAVAAAEAPKKEKKVKEQKPKKSPEELQAMRLANLKPRTKSPEQAAADEALLNALKDVLTKNPDGLGTEDILKAISTTPIEQLKAEKFDRKVRGMLRDQLNCTKIQTQGSNKKVYKLPAVA